MALSQKEVDDKIIEVVTRLQGCKSVELPLHPEITRLLMEEDVKIADILMALPRLVDEHRLIEIEYCLPDMDWRLKSIYLPAGTVVRVQM